MGVVVAAEDQLGLLDPVDSPLAQAPCSRSQSHLLIGLINILNGEDGEVSLIAEISEGDAGAGLDAQLVDGLLVDVQVDGHAEEGAVGEAVGLNNAAGPISSRSHHWIQVFATRTHCSPSRSGNLETIASIAALAICVIESGARRRCGGGAAPWCREASWHPAGEISVSAWSKATESRTNIPSMGEKPPLRISSRSHR